MWVFTRVVCISQQLSSEVPANSAMSPVDAPVQIAAAASLGDDMRVCMCLFATCIPLLFAMCGFTCVFVSVEVEGCYNACI